MSLTDIMTALARPRVFFSSLTVCETRTFFPSSHSSNINIKMSGILQDYDMVQLEEWIGTGPKDFQLLFSARGDGCVTETFREKCVNQGATVTVLYNTDNSIYGGYSSINWPTAYGKDDKAFLFQLMYNGISTYNKFELQTDGYHAVYSHSNTGPTFGDYPHDLKTFVYTVKNDNGRFKLNGHLSIGTSYCANGLQMDSINNGHMDVIDLQVFKVVESPSKERTDTVASADTWHEHTVSRTHLGAYSGFRMYGTANIAGAMWPEYLYTGRLAAYSGFQSAYTYEATNIASDSAYAVNASLFNINATDPDYWNVVTKPATRNENWMGKLEQSLFLSHLSVPGSHDSVARVGGLLGPAVWCQSLSLMDQMGLGIRFFDIRCRHYYNGLPIHHGSFYQHLNFTDVLKAMVLFLDEHPSECLIVRVKEEYKPEGNTRGFDESVRDVIDTFQFNRFWKSRDIPTLAYVRGKIVILQDFTSSDVFGIRYGDLIKADDWNAVGDDKWKDVETNLDKAQNATTDSSMYLTYTSTAGGVFHCLPIPCPRETARRINPRVHSYVHGRKGRLGIIAMDYPGPELVQDIIDSN